MRIDAPKDTPTHLLENPKKWITKMGKFMRKTSIDEMPQFFNILKGEMSFVGPRPALWNQNTLIEERDKYGVHKVLPGVTGWAQVNGRNAISWEQKFKLDIEYVEKQSFILDLKILCLTFLNVIQRKGISADGHATMEEFKG